MRPHGSVVAGSILAIFTAAGLSSAGLMRLPTNGGDSVTAPRALQAADAICVKSPASIAAVGMNVMMSAGVCVARVPWYAPKKKSLFCTIGPPNVPPN